MIKQETFQMTDSEGMLTEVTVGIRDEEYGWFEYYDVESGGEEWYAEGGLWINDKTITDYDGVFQLNPMVINKLKEWGYNTSEVE